MPDGVRGNLKEETRVAAISRQHRHQWMVLADHAAFALLEGRFKEAERLIFEALATGQRAADSDAMGTFGGQLLVLCVERGRSAEMAPGSEQMLKRFHAARC